MRIHTESLMSQELVQSEPVMASDSRALLDASYATLPLIQPRRLLAHETEDTVVLTRREFEILERLGRGLSMKGAARELAITPGTVKWHVKNIYSKLDASSRENALQKARSQNILK